MTGRTPRGGSGSRGTRGAGAARGGRAARGAKNDGGQPLSEPTDGATPEGQVAFVEPEPEPGPEPGLPLEPNPAPAVVRPPAESGGFHDGGRGATPGAVRMATHARAGIRRWETSPVVRVTDPLRGREILVAAAVAAVCTALLWFRTDHLIPSNPYFPLAWDHHMYIWMAEHGPLGLHIAPYGWRVLAPALVWAMPFEPQLGFQIVTLVSVWGTGLAVWVLLRRLGFLPELAIAGLLLYFALGYATKWTLFDFWLTDPLAFLLATCAVLFALSGRDVAFAVCLAAGVLAKESVIFVAPLAYALRVRRPWEPATALRILAATVPAVAVLIGLHVGIPARNDDPAYVAGFPRSIRNNVLPHYTYGFVLHDTLVKRWHHLGSTLVRSVSAFGLAVPVLVAVGLRSPRARSFALRSVPFLVLVYVQLLFAFNTERLLVLGLIAVVPLATWGLEQLMELRGTGPARYVGFAAAIFAAQLLGRHDWEPDLLVSFALLAAFALLVGPWTPSELIEMIPRGEPPPPEPDDQAEESSPARPGPD